MQGKKDRQEIYIAGQRYLVPSSLGYQFERVGPELLIRPQFIKPLFNFKQCFVLVFGDNLLCLDKDLGAEVRHIRPAVHDHGGFWVILSDDKSLYQFIAAGQRHGIIFLFVLERGYLPEREVFFLKIS